MNQSGVSASPVPRRPIDQHDREQDRRHGEEDDAQIGERQRQRLGRRRQQAQQGPARRASRATPIATATGTKAPIAVPTHAARAVDVAPAHTPGRSASSPPCRSRTRTPIIRNMIMLALEVAASALSPRKRPDPDRVDRAVQRLQDRGDERRQREGEQGAIGRIAPPVRSRIARLPPGQRDGAISRAAPAPRDISRRRDAFSAWSARAFSTASGLARSTKLGLSRRPASESRSFSAASAALARRAFSAVDVDHAFERQNEGRLVDHDLRRAAIGRASCRSLRSRGTGAASAAQLLHQPLRRQRALASRTCKSAAARPGGTFSSARAARMPLTSRISQSISGPASGSSARASGIGHLARISG